MCTYNLLGHTITITTITITISIFLAFYIVGYYGFWNLGYSFSEKDKKIFLQTTCHTWGQGPSHLFLLYQEAHLPNTSNTHLA